VKSYLRESRAAWRNVTKKEGGYFFPKIAWRHLWTTPCDVNAACLLHASEIITSPGSGWLSGLRRCWTFQDQSNLMHFSLTIWHLVASILINVLIINWAHLVQLSAGPLNTRDPYALIQSCLFAGSHSSSRSKPTIAKCHCFYIRHTPPNQTIMQLAVKGRRRHGRCDD